MHDPFAEAADGPTGLPGFNIRGRFRRRLHATCFRPRVGRTRRSHRLTIKASFGVAGASVEVLPKQPVIIARQGHRTVQGCRGDPLRGTTRLLYVANSLPTRNRPPSLQTPCSPTSSPITLFGTRTPRLVMARSGRGPAAPSIACAATPSSRLSSPGLKPIPREARKSRFQRPPRCFGPPCGCVVDRPRPVDRHRGRGGRGLENSKEK